MSYFRPEALAHLRRLSEPAFGAAVMALGLWIAAQGGVFLAAVGLAVAGLGLASAVLGWRRLRFAAGHDAPGMVEVDEGRVTYMGPKLGGSVGLPDLIEIRLLSLRGRKVWRLKQADGQVLLVPLDSAGAANLFDAFAALPGLTSAALVAALDAPEPEGKGPGLTLAGKPRDQLVWQRKGRGIAPV